MKFLRHLGNTITNREKGNPRLLLTSTMELENRDFRAMIYYEPKRGLIYHKSHKNLCETFGSIAPGKSTVSKWFREFEFGRSHFNDDNRCGRPVSAATQGNAARVKKKKKKKLIREDARITCKDLQDILGIGMCALNEILQKKKKKMIREDARIPCKDLQDILGIGMCALNEILHH